MENTIAESPRVAPDGRARLTMRRQKRSALDWHRDDLILLRYRGASTDDLLEYLALNDITVSREELSQWEANRG